MNIHRKERKEGRTTRSRVFLSSKKGGERGGKRKRLLLLLLLFLLFGKKNKNMARAVKTVPSG